MARTGRPKVNVDFDIVKKLCAIFATKNEIAGFLDISIETLERRTLSTYHATFAEMWDKWSARGKISIRRKQFLRALGGNTALLIFLGKNYLGQRDTPEVVVDTDKSIEVLKQTIAALTNTK